MKRLLFLLSIATLAMFWASSLHATVTYKLSYNTNTQVYTVSFNSTVAYAGGLARITPSTQFTIVVPDPDGSGAGAFSVTNLTALTALNWGLTQLNSPVENPTKDYLFFAPSNAGSYSPFNIAANTDIDLFSFKSSAPCSGTLYLFDNVTDPLNANMSVNADNNFKVLGGGNTNQYTGNSSAPVQCPPCLLSNITAITTNVSCFGGSNGTGNVVAADGTPPYAYNWPAGAGNQTTQTVSNLTAGTYTVTVTDAAGCTGTVTATITQPTQLTAVATSGTNVSCFGGQNGSVNVSSGGGTTPYTLLWSNGSSNQIVTGLSAGTYTITVTDANGCTKTSSATVTEPTQLLVAVTATTNASCFGGSNGSATATGSGGTTPYGYLWSNGQVTATATGLSAGTYTVTTTDSNNCTKTTTAVITAPAALVATISSQTNVLCFGAASGSAGIAVSGGTPNFTYLWPVSAGSQTTVTAAGLSASVYTATVTDGQGCIATVEATITQPAAALSIAMSSVQVSCGGTNNGSATATPSGGVSPYAYLWSSGATAPSANNLSIGTYTVTITDQNGCTATANATISQNTGTVSYKLTLDPDGETYQVSFNSTVAYTGPLARITGSTQFTLVFPDPDGSGAGAVQLSNVISLTALDMDYTQLNSPTQSPSKDYAFFAPTNAASYTVFNIPANTDIALFTFKITGGCNGTINLFDNYADPLNANLNVSADNSFKTLGGGNVSLYCNNATGPLTCPNCNLSNITAVTTDVSCFGGNNGEATIIAADGVPQYSYAWPASAGNQTTQTVTNLVAGTYTVTVTDGVGCTGTVTFTITQPTQLTAAASVATPILCFGASTGSVTVTISGGAPGYSILWPNGSTDQTISGLAAGTYTVTVTDSKSCTATSVATITQPAQALLATITSSTNVACAGAASGSATVTASGGASPYMYLWSNGQTSAAATGLTAGTYTVTVTDANSCTKTSSVTLTQPNALTASISAQTNVLCFGASTGSATITASGGAPNYSYLWPASAGSQTTATGINLAAGTYVVTVTDANTCTTTVNVNITQPVLGLTVAINAANVSCGGTNNGSATATPTGGIASYSYLWSSGATAATANNLGVGTYTVTVTDQNGCTATSSVAIGQNTGSVTYKLTLDPDGQTYRVSFRSSIAYTGPLARITGSTQFTLVFPDPDGSGAGAVQISNLTSLTALHLDYTQLNSPAQSPGSDYLFFAPDNAGSYPVFNIPANTDIDLFTFKIPAGCIGSVALFDNYADPLNVNLNVSADNSFKTLGGGNTNLYCNNSSGPIPCTTCLLSNITAVTTDVSCFGGNNGAATVIPADGVPQYSYVWPASAGSQTTQTVTNLVAGTYIVTVTDGVGCTGTVSVVIAQPTQLTAAASVLTQVLCFGGSSGSVTVAMSGGTPGYSILWPNGSTDQTISGLSAGMYTVTVTDSKSCTATSSVTVSQPAQDLLATITSSTNVACAGTASGSATVTATGGTSPYMYLWSDGQTTATATGLSAGTYTVTVTDANNCTKTSSVTITQPSALTASISAQTNVLCNGASTGSATVTAIGGTPNYSYLWPVSAGGQTTATGNNLAAGTYIVTVTDANACTKTVSVNITQPASALTVAVNGVNVSCGGSNNGSATATPAGGTPGYSYLWSSGATTATASNLGVGTYTVTITDQNGCTATSSLAIGQNTGSVTYKLTLDPDGQTYRVSFNSSIAYTGPLARITGSSQFTLVFPDPDGTGPGAIQIANLTSLTALHLDYTQLNSPVQSPGSDYLFFAPDNAGSYTVFNIPANTDIDLFTFKIPAGCTGFVALFDNYADPLNADLNVSADNSFKTLGGGNTNLYCNNSSGPVPCSTCLLSNITIVSSNVNCFGGSNGSATAIPADGTPQYSYLWSNGATTQTAINLIAGTYTVTVTDGLGCTGTKTVTITQPLVLTASAAQTTAVSCFGGSNGSATVTAGGGAVPYIYLWSSGSADQIATGLAAGTYTVTVTDNNGCTKTASATITQPATAVSVSTTQVNVSCFGGSDGSATATGTGGTGAITYLWSNGQTTATATNLTAGTYNVTATDANGCTKSASVVITELPQLTASISAQTNVLCNGASTGTATATAAGGTTPYSYLWTNGQTTATTTGLAAGTYSVTVTDFKGCTATTSVTITQPTALIADITSQTNVGCNGTNTGSATVNATGGTTPYTYLWTGGQTTATALNLAAGTYTVTVTDANACTKTTSVTITQSSTLTANAAQTTAVSCFGGSNGSATVTAGGGATPYIYLWSSGSTDQIATGLAAGTYTVTVTDNNGCTKTANATITQPATAVSVTVTSTVNPNCEGAISGSATVTAVGGTPGYTYLWSNGQTTATATALSAGTYIVTVTDTRGCTAIATTVLTDPTGVNAIISAKTDVNCFGGNNGSATVTASGGTMPYVYLWSNGQTTATATALSAGIYTVTVSSNGANTCTAIATVQIFQPTQLIAEIIDHNNVLCFGVPTGSATVNATGGTTPYTYAWPASAGSQTTATANNLSAGVYIMTVTDAKACTTTASVTITQPAQALSGTTTINSQVFCFGGDNGAATANPSGGTAPYQYLWSNGRTDKTVSQLSAGSYTVTITDQNGCTTTATATITQPATPVTANITAITNPNCEGSSSGLATVAAGGGVPGYSYLWSNGQSTATATGLTAGTYLVTVTDTNGCTAVATTVLFDPTGVNATISAKTDVSCFGGNNGSATISATGGIAPYQYLWSNGQTTATAINLGAGVFTVTVTSSGASTCTAIATVQILQPTLLTLLVGQITPPACAGSATGSATVLAAGGTTAYTYAWPASAGSQTTATATNLATGIYVVTLTDANNCTATATVNIPAATNLAMAPIANIGPLCPGFIVPITLLSAIPANNNVSYSWTGGSGAGLNNGNSTGLNANIPAFTADLTEGLHTVTVTATLATCTATTTFTVNIDDSTPPVLTGCPSNITLNNDVDLCSTVYAWQSPTATDACGNVSLSLTGGPVSGSTFNVGAPQTITYTANDGRGNTASCSFTVTVIDVQAPKAVCKDLIINLNAAGTETLNASQLNGGSTDNCTAAGSLTLVASTTNFNCAQVGNNNVTLTVTDTAGNSATCVATVTVRDLIPPTFTCPPAQTVPSCLSLVPDVITGLNATDNCAVATITQNPVAGLDFGNASGNVVNITVTVTDVNGNTSTCLAPVTIQDIIPPVFANCPTTMIMIGNDLDQCSGKLNWSVPVATDNCNLQSLLQTAGPAPGTAVSITCPPSPQTITYKATDASGNMAFCTFQVMVVDTEKPEYDADIVMPGNITVECNAVPAPFVLTNNDVNDNCTAPANLVISYTQTSTQNNNPGACGGAYVLTRTWTVTDCAGNALTHTQIITVQDTQKPTAICKNITITLNDFGNASITPQQLDGGSSDNCAPNASLIFTASKTTFDCSNLGANNVTLTVTDPCGNISTCTAVVTVLQGNGSCNPVYDVNGSDPCVCLNNATTLDNGQFSEFIQIIAIAGQNWSISSSNGLYASNSPNPPAAPIPLGNGTPLINGQFDGVDNDGDNTIDEPDERVYYTLRARHIEGVGYTAVIANTNSNTLTFSNTCYYPTPYFTNLDDPFCLNTPIFEIKVGEQNNAQGTVTITVNGVATNQFNAAALGEGFHTITATVDAGTAQPYTVVNGITVNGSQLAAQADPGCQQSITQVVQVVGTPTTVVCNDLVYVSLDADCIETINADGVLEGTYLCYDDYTVEVDKTLPYGNGPWVTATFNASDIGKIYTYHVIHPISGNVCWGQIKIEDKLAPALTCPANITVACSESTDTPHTGNVGIDDCSTTTTVIDDEYTDFGQCNTPRGQIVRTWIVTDASNNQSTCSQTIVITPFDLGNVVFPADITLNCEVAYLNPNATKPDATGRPSINGFPIGAGGLCTASINFTDEIFDICPGSYEILRTWKIRNTCSPVGPSNPIEHTQVIQLQDLGGPAFACPPAVTVSTDPYQCCATAALPDMIISEGCSKISDLEAKVTGTNPANGNIITFTVSGHLGDFPGNNYWNPDTLAIFPYTQCLPLGVYTVQYTAADQCGNTSKCAFQMTIADLVPPVAACDQWTQVDLGGDGTALVNASTFDDGSKDNCAPVEFKVRRTQPNDCQSDTVFYDQVKFCCSDINDTIQVVFRVYDVDVPTGEIALEGYEGHYNDCMVQVLVKDKIKPTCTAPANTSVDCENFDPSLWAYGAATAEDNCCIDTIIHSVNYSQFDTVCNRGTITRTFRAFDCGGLSSQCTQRVIVNYLQDYYIKFPNDMIVTTCDGTGIYGEPTFFGKDCELLGISFEDQVFTVVSDACFEIERTWKIINWCTFNPNLPLTFVPNPNPNATSNNPQNLPGPIVSAPGTAAPWVPTLVKVLPTDATATNYSSFWTANSNGYVYKQIIKISDAQDPTVENCPDSLVTYCDVTPNDPLLWNETYWWDNLTGQHDLCEGPADLTITATDACSGTNIDFQYLLFLDLDGDGTMETVVNSLSTGVAGGLPWNTVFFGNANSPNFIGGTARAFDGRAVPNNQKYGFTLQTSAVGNKRTASVRWNTQQSQNTFVVPELPYGKHKIKWIIEDGCGNESFCEYNFEVKDCKKPTVVCLNGLSVNIMPNGMITLWASDFLKYTEDNCTPASQIKTGIRRSGTGTGFPLDGNGNPVTSVNFTCDDLGTQLVELWGLDLAGNADYCETYVIVQDNAGNCINDPNAAKVAGTLATELSDGVEEGSVEITGSGSGIPTYTFATMSDNQGLYRFNAVPKSSNSTVTPLKDDNPLNGVSTYDLVLISKHILGIEPLGSPYKMIAADANKSGSITTFDIVELRKLILGIYADLPFNTSWRFVDKSFVFPNPLNPFQTQFPETKLISDIQSNHIAEDFVSVKVGDVNGTVIANSLMSADDRSAGTLLFDVAPVVTGPTPALPGREGDGAASGISSIDAGAVRVGQTFTVNLTPDQLVAGYQFTLNTNGLEVVDVTGLKGENYAVFADALTFSVDGQAAQGTITLTLKATQSGKLNEMMSISSRITKAEGYPAYAKASAGKGALDVALRFNVGGTSTISGVGFELYQNQPNPFVDKTVIGFYLPAYAESLAGKKEGVTLTIYDETGRLIHSKTGDFAKGYNYFTVEKALLNTIGALYYKVETATDRAVKQMIQVK